MRAVILVLMLLTGCETENYPVCIPATTEACFCGTGERGERACADDGHRFKGCLCRPDAGVDAPLDSDTGIDLEAP
jgi:hypothetical protein